MLGNSLLVCVEVALPWAFLLTVYKSLALTPLDGLTLLALLAVVALQGAALGLPPLHGDGARGSRGPNTPPPSRFPLWPPLSAAFPVSIGGDRAVVWLCTEKLLASREFAAWADIT